MSKPTWGQIEKAVKEIEERRGNVQQEEGLSDRERDYFLNMLTAVPVPLSFIEGLGQKRGEIMFGWIDRGLVIVEDDGAGEEE